MRQHVMVLTSSEKSPFLLSAVEIDHEISSNSWLNYSNPPDYSDSPEHNQITYNKFTVFIFQNDISTEYQVKWVHKVIT